MDILKTADLGAVARTWGEVQKDLATHAPNFYIAWVILNEIYTGRIVNYFSSIQLDLKVHPILKYHFQSKQYKTWGLNPRIFQINFKLILINLLSIK